MSNIIDKEVDLEKMLRSNQHVLVLFYSSWCPYCSRFLPVFEKYASKNEEHFCRVEVDNMEQCESKYSIDVVPTVLFFKNAEVVKRLDGTRGEGLNEKQLLSMIDSCGLGSK